MNIADIITQATPHAVALVEGARSWTYAELDAAIWRAAAALRKLGIAPGDVVGVTLPNSALHVACGYALARLGAVQLPLSPGEAAGTRQALARRFKAATVLDSRNVDPAWLERGGDGHDESLRSPGGDAPWKLVLSSGTTGEPKAVLQTHAMHLGMRELMRAAIPVRPEERCLAVVPVSFFAAFRLVMDVHSAGAAVILGEELSTAEAFFEAVERTAANYLYLTPTHLQRAVRAVPDGAPRLPQVRRLRTGSMVVPEALRREARTRLTPNLLVTYGTNDYFSPLTAAPPAVQDRYPDSVGLPIAGIELGIADEAGKPLPAGEVGEVRARGPCMPSGYVDDPAASARAFRDGWYYTGDIGERNAEGALFLRGRRDDVINFEGIKIYPAEIENVLLAHPSVAEAAAFALGSPAHLPVAAAVLRGKATVAELLQHCRHGLGARAPVSILVLPSLPRNAAGKVDRRELSRMMREAAKASRAGRT